MQSTRELIKTRKSSKKASSTYLSVIKHVNPTKQVTLGPVFSNALETDPRYLGFSCARHKFAAKMLHGMNAVLEIGCNEGLGTCLVAKSVGRIVAIDYYQPYVAGSIERFDGIIKNAEFRVHDILDNPVAENFDGAFCLDVIEHIDPKQEALFLRNIAASLKDEGVLVIGSPSLESQIYASPPSKRGHINCRSGENWREVYCRHFRNVFMFGMNDEVLHTGFLPMAHYIIALCVGPIR